MLTWELLGAVVGAGMASGREIASFFGRYGAWGYAGIALSAVVMGLLAGARMPSSWRGRWPERLWRAASALLLAVTGGAMLAGAGDLLAPGGGVGRWIGMAATLALAWLLAHRTRWGLAWVSRVLMAGMGALLFAALTRPGEDGLPAAPFAPGGVMRAMAYGGFNAAMLTPVMAGRQGTRRALAAALTLLSALMAAGLTVLMRHPSVMEAPLPFARLMGEVGTGGRLLAQVCLYLAILSTLVACLRALPPSAGLIGVAAAAMMGFTGAVERAYPLLGAVCGGMLAAMRVANFTNSRRTTFHSRRGVL